MSLAFARKTREAGVLTHSHVRVLVHIWGSDMRARGAGCCLHTCAHSPLIIRRRETSQLVNVAKIIISQPERIIFIARSLRLRSRTLLFAEERFIISRGPEKLSCNYMYTPGRFKERILRLFHCVVKFVMNAK